MAETDILKQVEMVFRRMTIPEPLLDALTKHLRDSHAGEMDFHRQEVERLQKEHREITDMLNRLLDTFLRQRITEEVYDKKVYELNQRKAEIEHLLAGHSEADDSFRLTVSSLFSLASRAWDIYQSSKNAQKRRLIQFVFSNLRLRGANLEYSLRSPFHLMVGARSYQGWLGD